MIKPYIKSFYIGNGITKVVVAVLKYPIDGIFFLATYKHMHRGDDIRWGCGLC